MSTSVHIGFEIGTGAPVAIPLRHMVVTGQTQEAGKTTTLEALIARSGVKAVAFITKRGEGSFDEARTIAPYFREQADWQFVASILEASRGEKLKFERAWIIRASKGARTLADVHRNVKKALESAKGLSADVYLTLDAYLEAVVPQIDRVKWAQKVELAAGVSAMDLTALNVEMQHLVIRSTLDWVLNHEEDTVVVVPEAWKFIPQGRGTPVKLGAEAYIRQAAGLRNYLWLDSQDIAGVEKMILKSVPVWILGVQRESNEVKRTLDQIPAGIKKPKPESVATLGLGEFYVCHGTHITKVYAQPVWMGEDEARAIALGADKPVRTVRAALRAEQLEVQVNEAEAERLRTENAELRRRVGELEELVLRNGHQPAVQTPAKPSPLVKVETTYGVDVPLDVSALYDRLVQRFLQDADAIVEDLLKQHPKLTVRVSRPELDVEVTRETIAVDGKTLRGRIARLLAEGFLDKGVTANGVQKELARLGKDPGPGNAYTEMKTLAELGFVTIEQGKDSKSRPCTLYRAVAGMKVNIVEAR